MASHSTLDDDDEDLLQQLSKEELEQLSEIIDPDVRTVVEMSVLYSYTSYGVVHVDVQAMIHQCTYAVTRTQYIIYDFECTGLVCFRIVIVNTN